MRDDFAAAIHKTLLVFGFAPVVVHRGITTRAMAFAGIGFVRRCRGEAGAIAGFGVALAESLVALCALHLIAAALLADARALRDTQLARIGGGHDEFISGGLAGCQQQRQKGCDEGQFRDTVHSGSFHG